MDERTLSFGHQGVLDRRSFVMYDKEVMCDRETDSLRVHVTGEAIKGELEGVALKRLPATPWLAVRWRGFYPEGEVVKTVRKAPER